ncbi:MAG: hypothetical protein Q7T25_10675 [Sideroxyarcus sp.]|nr:hypothetical protein [Sideroxyarcus sp.]
MSLDLAVLAESGKPEHTVSLSVNLHFELICAAKKFLLNQLLRLDDYYEDIEILSDDLPELLSQVNALRKEAGSDDLYKFLDEIIGLINIAKSSHRSIHSIAD